MMQKGVKTRLSIFNILYSIFNNKKNYDNIFYDECYKNKFSLIDKAMINNVSLNSMRYNFHVRKFLKKYIKNNIKKKQFILLLSAIVQIVYLNFKDYAVVNSTVEVAKIVKIHPGFINAVLKKIIINKKELTKFKIDFSSLPVWFLKNTKNLTIQQKNEFINNYYKLPNIHLVFKDHTLLKNFSDDYIKTTSQSLIIKQSKHIENLSNYKKGDWWVQDFSSMLPLNLTPNLKGKKIIDLCAAPGGKTFQALSKGANVTANDKNKKRNSLLKENLFRLKYNIKLMQNDAQKINIKNKFDFVLLDAPCSAVGTIRRNPEIFFRNTKPNLESLIILQKNLLQKGSSLLKKNGVIVYMVCSFLKKETFEQINFFLEKNKKYKIWKFTDYSKEKDFNEFITQDGFLYILPKYYQNFFIDGFFAARLIKNG